MTASTSSFEDTLCPSVRRGDAEQGQRASRGALREGSPNLRRDRGSRADGGDGERRVCLSGGASGQDLPHSRPRRTERLRGKEHGDHGEGTTLCYLQASSS